MLKTKHTNIYDLYNEVKHNGFDDMSVREKIDVSLGYPRISMLLMAIDEKNEGDVENEFSRTEYLEAYAERTTSDSDIENAFFGFDVEKLDEIDNHISDETKKNMIEFYRDVLNVSVEITNRHKDNEVFASMIAFGVIMMDPMIVDVMGYGLKVEDLIEKSESKVFKEMLTHLANDTIDDVIWNDIIKRLHNK